VNPLIQLLINSALQLLVSSLKGGAAATATAFLAGQPVTAAKVTIGPGEHVVITAQLTNS
jgi:hypothetical protein